MLIQPIVMVMIVIMIIIVMTIIEIQAVLRDTFQIQIFRRFLRSSKKWPVKKHSLNKVDVNPIWRLESRFL